MRKPRGGERAKAGLRSRERKSPRAERQRPRTRPGRPRRQGRCQGRRREGAAATNGPRRAPAEAPEERAISGGAQGRNRCRGGRGGRGNEAAAPEAAGKEPPPPRPRARKPRPPRPRRSGPLPPKAAGRKEAAAPQGRRRKNTPRPGASAGESAAAGPHARRARVGRKVRPRNGCGRGRGADGSHDGGCEEDSWHGHGGEDRCSQGARSSRRTPATRGTPRRGSLDPEGGGGGPRRAAAEADALRDEIVSSERSLRA